MHLRSSHKTLLRSSAAEIARASAVPLPVQRKSRVIVARDRDVRAFGPKRPGNVGGLPCLRRRMSFRTTSREARCGLGPPEQAQASRVMT